MADVRGAPTDAATADGVRVEHTSRPERLGQAGWDQLAGGGALYASAAWLQLAQDTMQGDSHYLLGWDGGGLASGLACYLFRTEAPFAPRARIDRTLARCLSLDGTAAAGPRSRVLTRLLPNLACGGRQIADTRLLLADRLAGSQRPHAIRATVAAAERLAAGCGAASLSFNCVDGGDHELRRELLAAGYREFFNMQRCVLKIEFADLEGYLGRFRHHRRNTIRSELRRLDAAAMRYESSPLERVPLATLAELERNLLRRYGVRRSPQQIEASLRELAARFAGRAIAATGHLDGQLAGFVALVRWRDHLHAREAGFDYERLAGLPAYFGIMFYQVIELACRTGAVAIDYGTGSIATKVSRGCEAIDLYGYVRCLDERVGVELSRLLAGQPGG